MKNNLKIILTFLIANFFVVPNINSQEIFNFNVTNIEISENGNLFKGYGGGEANTNDGVTIIADRFEYDKLNTILSAEGNVFYKDTKRNIIIEANQIIYLKKLETIKASGDIKIIDNLQKIILTSENLKYSKIKKLFEADTNVEINDIFRELYISAEKILYFSENQEIIADTNAQLINNKKNISVKSEKISYKKKLDRFLTSGITEANIYSKYKFLSKDVNYDGNLDELSSVYKTKISSKFSTYELDEFNFQIKNEYLKGKNIFVFHNEKSGEKEGDKFYIENGFFDLKNENFKTGPIKINLKKNTFDRSKNDPRLYGISSSKTNNVTSLKKAVFTSCEKRDKCPPWNIQASEIKHDKDKKQLIYKDAVLKVYDVPVFYFPKFFHPDPSVKRQSGFLLPRLNNSNILGSSISTPYFYEISDNKDMTFTPNIFSKNIQMLQTEFRQQNKNSYLITDFGFVKDFKSSQINKKKNINHFFGKFTKKFELDNFIDNSINLFVERLNKDTYLKIFNSNLSQSTIKPKNPDVLNSGVDFFLEHEKYKLTGGFNIYEDLTVTDKDRFQFILPYYNFTKNINSLDIGTFNFSSRGDNILDNTNNMKSKVINDFSFKTNNLIFDELGIKNNFNVYFKNLNSVGKNVSNYKSSPQIELQSLLEFNSELPLIKYDKDTIQTLIPRISYKFNPGDMKNHSDAERKININNIFDANRIGVDDTFEAGSSLTLGINYKNENSLDSSRFLEYNLATVFRDNDEKNIPSQTSLNKKQSNIFGSINYNFSKYGNLEYNFALNNNIDNFEYNSISLGLSLNNFITKFNFIEEELQVGNTNIFENVSTYNFNENNMVSFKTRRNREINLTEYYDLVYEYKIDCLTAGIKFNKTYYEDRDLKPSENIMFTISFYPLTSIEQSFKK